MVNRLKQKWKNLTGRSKDKETTALTDELTTALSSLVKAKDWESIREFLKETDMLTLLHIVDIGGQPECHEILPLLLHGLALNLIFLNVTCKTWTPPTLWCTELMVDSVPSSTSQNLPSERSSSVPSAALPHSRLVQIHKPAAILIGTYLDQSSEAAVLTLDRSIQEAFKDADFMKNDILCPVSKPGEEKRYIHPLDNVSGGSNGDIWSFVG